MFGPASLARPCVMNEPDSRGDEPGCVSIIRRVKELWMMLTQH